MNKKLFLLPVLALVLTGCGGNNPSPSVAPSTPSTEPSTPTDPAKARHDAYIAGSTSTEQTTIQGVVYGYEHYAGNANSNIFLMEGEYGYHVNNVPNDKFEVGKSYKVTGVGYTGPKAKEYPCLNYKSIEATSDIAKTPYVIGANGNNFSNGQGGLCQLESGKKATVTAIDTEKLEWSFTVEGVAEATFKFTYNSGVDAAGGIKAICDDIKVGHEISKLNGYWIAEDTFRVFKAEDLVVDFPAPTGVTVTAEEGISTIGVGGKLQLSAAVAPEKASQAVDWSVSQGADFVEVDANGLVTAKATGTAKIAATAKGSTIKGEYDITVGEVAPTAITVTLSPSTVAVGGEAQATAVAEPAYATQAVTFTSESDSIATVVAATGAVTGVATGKTNIVATTTVGGSTVNGKAEIIVGTVLNIKNVDLCASHAVGEVVTDEITAQLIYNGGSGNGYTTFANADGYFTIYTKDTSATVLDGEIQTAAVGSIYKFTSLTVKSFTSKELTNKYFSLSVGEKVTAEPSIINIDPENLGSFTDEASTTLALRALASKVSENKGLTFFKFSNVKIGAVSSNYNYLKLASAEASATGGAQCNKSESNTKTLKAAFYYCNSMMKFETDKCYDIVFVCYGVNNAVSSTSDNTIMRLAAPMCFAEHVAA